MISSTLPYSLHQPHHLHKLPPHPSLSSSSAARSPPTTFNYVRCVSQSQMVKSCLRWSLTTSSCPSMPSRMIWDTAPSHPPPPQQFLHILQHQRWVKSKA